MEGELERFQERKRNEGQWTQGLAMEEHSRQFCGEVWEQLCVMRDVDGRTKIIYLSAMALRVPEYDPKQPKGV